MAQSIVRLVLIGDGNVGKTRILISHTYFSYRHDEFTTDYKPTISPNFEAKQVEIDKHTITLQIWDSSSQNRFIPLTRDADGCILVYDVTNAQSLEAVTKWKDQFRREIGLSNDAHFPFLLIGNKADLPNRAVEEADGAAFARENGQMLFYEVSAKTSENLNDAFLAFSRKILGIRKEDKAESPPSSTASEHKNVNRLSMWFKNTFQRGKTGPVEDELLDRHRIMNLDVIKLAMVGDSGVGKTCVMNRAVSEPFVERTPHTIGSGVRNVDVCVDGKETKIQMWDTAGKENYRTLVPVYLRDALGVILVYDVSDRKSFDSLEKTWLEDVCHPSCAVNTQFMLLAKKCDIGERAVSREEGEAFARAHKNMLYHEVSAKNDDNIKDALNSFVEKIIWSFNEEKNGEKDCKQDNVPSKSLFEEIESGFNGLVQKISAFPMPDMSAWFKDTFGKTEAEVRNPLNVIFLGDTNVGKTTILTCLAGRPVCSEAVRATTGVSFLKTNVCDDIPVTLWDTPGIERFRMMSLDHFASKSQIPGIVLVYSASDYSSFESLNQFLEMAHKSCPNAQLMVIANKCDVEERAVMREEGEEFAREHGNIPYREVYDINDEDIRNLLEDLVKMITDTETPVAEASEQPTSVFDDLKNGFDEFVQKISPFSKQEEETPPVTERISSWFSDAFHRKGRENTPK